ncbi:hypothetical protein [Halogeometricum limi]|uniref:Uncharacterized protein n=1 Tax=Halogeometricum limi TaxID=555875 RepID=A0A1I6IQE0_9EURY|nr:hypothetical protein [Halogeometricum limi]SFR68954.1 hypothetical protein SAMN04488124_3505 [Halogeometricum limi]
MNVSGLVSTVPLSLSDQLVTLLRPYASLVLPGVLVLFFVAASAAVVLSDRWHARRAFVLCFFVGLLLSNFLLPVSPLPFVSWGHFSQPTSEVETYREIRLVDESGHEIKMDDGLTLAFDSVSERQLIRHVRGGQSDARNETEARRLLARASQYREAVGRGETGRIERFPHHGLTSRWTPELLDGYERFVGVRVYEMTFVTSEDGTHVVRYEEAVVFESFPLADAESIPARASSMPTRSMNRTGPRERSRVVAGAGLARTGVTG